MPPKLPDFANISERLRKALRLEHRIVVIGLSDTPPANLPHYEGEPLKACQMLDTVRFEGKSFYTVQNDHYECKNAIRWLGFDESYEGHFSGEWATGDYPDNGRALFRAPAFSRRMYLHIDCLFRFLCVFSVYVYLYDSARHLSIIPHFFCCQTYCPYDNTSRHKF